MGREFSLKQLLAFIVIFTMAVSAFAINGKTTYQAKIIKPNGYPLEATNVNFRFTILDPSASCVLYIENYAAVDMTGTQGLISFSLGMGVKTYPTSGTVTFEKAFDNAVPSLACQSPGIYNPLPTDNRKVVMQFNDGNGWQTLPAMAINAVPYAMFATRSQNSEKLNGKADTSFVEYSTLASLNCASDEAIKFNGVNFSCISVNGSGGVTSGSVVSALGFTPADGASVTALTSNVLAVSSTVFSVSSTVTSLANTVSSLNSTIATSLAAITSSQWNNVASGISYLSGNVGVGVSAPTARLDLRSESGDKVIRLQYSGTSFGTQPNMEMFRSRGTVNNPTGVLANDTLGSISAGGHDGSSFGSGSAAAIQFKANDTFTPTSRSSFISFWTTASGSTTNSERVRITESGNVGVGTNAPTNTLHAYRAATMGSGWGGFNTASAVVRIQENTGSGLYLDGNSLLSDVTGAFYLGTLQSQPVTFGTSDTERMRIESDGKVGIGTQTPATTFHVSGSVRVSNGELDIDAHPTGVTVLDMNIASPATLVKWRMLVDSDETLRFRRFLNPTGSGDSLILKGANVGVGLTNPTARLHIPAGTTGTAAFKFTSGTLLTSPQSGTIEYDGFYYYVTDGNNIRRAIATSSASGSVDNVTVINNTSGNITLAPIGSVIVSSTTASTNSSTGALVVNGGLGVAGDIYTSGTIVTTSNIQGVSVTATSGVISPYIAGSIASSGALTLDSTTHATKGNILLAPHGGSVGIGTSSPTSVLNIVSNLSTNDLLNIERYNDNNASAGFRAKRGRGTASSPSAIMSGDIITGLYGAGYHSGGAFGGNSTAIQYIAINDYTSIARGADIAFETTASGTTSRNEKMRLTSTGSLGIGTSAPTGILDVVSSNYPVMRAERLSTVSASIGVALTLQGTTSVDMANNFGVGIDFRLKDDTSAATNLGRLAILRDGADDKGSMVFQTTNGGSPVERLRISASGTVGIGTNAPLALLDVRGAVRIASSSTNYLEIQPNQDVSSLNPGTTTSTAVVVQGAANASLIMDLRNNNEDDAFAIRYSSSQTTNVDSIGFVMRGNGNVGIGVTNPAEKLEVNGDIKLKNYKIKNFTNSTGSGSGEWIKIARIQNNPVQTSVSEVTNISGRVYSQCDFGGSGSRQYIADFSFGVRPNVKPLLVEYGDCVSGAGVDRSVNAGFAIYQGADGYHYLYFHRSDYSTFATFEFVTTSSIVEYWTVEDPTGIAGHVLVWDRDNNTGAQSVVYSGHVGVGTVEPTAKLHLAAGTSSTAPLKFTVGTILSSAQSGTMEYDGNNFYLTDSNNIRRAIATGSSSGSIDNANAINSSGNIVMTPSGSVVVSSTTPSTNSQTGALVVKGGLGVAGNIYSSGTIITSSNIQGASITATSGIISPYIAGSVASGGNLNLDSTTHSSKGNILLAPSGGNVGIGTNNPNYPLHIQSSSTSLTAVATLETTGVNGRPYLLFRAEGASTGFLGVPSAGSSNMSLYNYLSGSLTFGTSSTARMSIDASGNVGIGTTNPTANLHIVRTSAASPIVTFADNAAANNFSDVEVEAFRPGFVLRDKSVSADDFRIGADEGKLYFTADLNDSESKDAASNYSGSSILTMLSTGNVGIGNSNPLFNLSIHNTSPVQMELRHAGGAKNDPAKFVIDETVDNSGEFWIVPTDDYDVGSANDKFHIGDYDTRVSRFTVNGAGYVGIGTSAPTVSLDVNPPSDSGSSQIQSTGYGTGFRGNVMVRSARGDKTSPTAIQSSDALGVLGFMGYTGAAFSGSRASVRATATENWTTGANGTSLSFWTTASSSTSSVERVTITDAGNVGIGTSSPTHPLTISSTSFTNLISLQGNHVNSVSLNITNSVSGGRSWSVGTAGGAAIPVGNFMIFDNTANESRFLISSNGNVGIGTTTPAAPLDIQAVQGTSSDRGMRVNYFSNATTNGGVFRFYTYKGTPSTSVAVTSAQAIGALDFQGFDGTSLQQGAVISVNADGAVSTGAVPMNIRFLTGSFAGNIAERMRIDSSGNIGIGTTAPSTPLTVSGTIRSLSGGFQFPDGTIQTTASTAGTITDWVNDGASILGAQTTAPTKGTIATDSVRWRRVGDTMEMRWNYVQTTAGTVGSGYYLITIPDSYAIDTAKLPVPSSAIDRRAYVGTISLYYTGRCTGSVYAYNTTQLWAEVNCVNGTNTAGGAFGSGYMDLGQAANMSVNIDVKFPVSGW